ncbi:tRNA pseudouridine38-40 synthase [Haloferula luteola]|uniref:tRNA pseudouridine synthase A n=1 Tax=Haloferula luteola TaxID=595692 RepID=A0A840V902_9BACT|nr:tRNA pseudouridine(38-40) synthase TruA [Haloferula luteola]MBB5350259.1 tRNA pseudouridine38-40 synthase [Haloferula luteola]
MRLKLTLAYDGRSFDGWQSQPGGNTLQDHLEKAASTIAKTPLRVHGSGRTDAGVHARAQVAHLDAPDSLSMLPMQWLAALNTQLPRSFRVLQVDEVPSDFHARFSATGKTYTYDLCLTPILSPFRYGWAWHLPRGVDPQLLASALDSFIGHHDFQGFCARRGNETESTDHHRTLSQASFKAIDDGLRLTFTGDGFLYKMVRLLTGSAVQVAQRRCDLAALISLLDQPAGLPHGRSSHCAPADGLFLEAVHYE